jgi:hypothetical protein
MEFRRRSQRAVQSEVFIISSRRFALIVAAFLSCTKLGAAHVVSEVPAVIPSPYTAWPSWVAADLAVAPDGSLREAMLGQHTSTLRDVARANAALIAKEAHTRDGNATPEARDDRCRITFGAIPRNERPLSSLDELTAHAAAIVSGEVLAARQGFFGGQPGTLLLLDAKYLKGTPAAVVLFFYPFAEINTTEGAICTKPLGDYLPPEAGDRLLIFAMSEPVIENGRTILSVNVEHQLIHARQGRTLAPRAVQSLAGESASFDVLERAVLGVIDRSSKSR